MPREHELHMSMEADARTAWNNGDMTAATIKFTVRRRPAVLVAPAAPTPRELKRLSDLDIQDILRVHVSSIHFFRRTESMGGKDPAVVIRDAIARALVPYYPFAGRLREHDDGGRFAVDCTAEGVLFIEADADVRLERFGDALLPPFPCVEELIFDVPGSSAILNAPLLLFQVTRLACGGFVLGVRLNHTMADGVGMTQFLGAVAELARGDAQAPTVLPVWERHLLEGRRDAPRRSDELDLCNEHDDSSILLALSSSSLDDVHGDMVIRFFFFGSDEIAAIRAQLPPPLDERASRFETIAGWLWKCRTMALAPADSDEVMLMSIVVSARGRRRTGGSAAGIPTGYYGNAFAEPIAVSTARELASNPVGYAVGLVKAAKDKVDMEYMRSAADLIVQRRWRIPRGPAGLYSLTDHTKVGLHDLDFGWGRPVYGGMAEAIENPDLPWQSSYVLPFKKNAGGGEDDGAVVPVCLPRLAMDRLVDEMGKLRRRRRSPADVVATLQEPRHGLFPAVVKRSAI